MGEKRVPAPALYGVMSVWIGIVVVLAFTAGPVLATRALAASMIGLALVRMCLPTGIVPDIRGRWWDSFTLAAFGIALASLSSWAAMIRVD